ncbi:MAG: hypothetical protein P8N92_04505, partial [Burkholderiales bacterium]|nr:hypothetical protein [Burkholderiales bacterium]
ASVIICGGFYYMHTHHGDNFTPSPTLKNEPKTVLQKKKNTSKGELNQTRPTARPNSISETDRKSSVPAKSEVKYWPNTQQGAINELNQRTGVPNRVDISASPKSDVEYWPNTQQDAINELNQETGVPNKVDTSVSPKSGVEYWPNTQQDAINELNQGIKNSKQAPSSIRSSQAFQHPNRKDQASTIQYSGDQSNLYTSDHIPTFHITKSGKPKITHINNGIIENRYATNWKAAYGAPHIFVATWDQFIAHKMEYDQSVIEKINISFDRTTQEIIIQASGTKTYKKTLVLVEIIANGFPMIAPLNVYGLK